MNNQSAGQSLEDAALEAAHQVGSVVISRAVWQALLPPELDLDSSATELINQGRVEELDSHTFLLLTGVRPDFEFPRFWSNPDLEDPHTICALVSSNPSLRDVTRALTAYGFRTMEKALAAVVDDNSISPWIIDITERMMTSSRQAMLEVAHGTFRSSNPSVNALKSDPAFTEQAFLDTCDSLSGRAMSPDLYTLWRFLTEGGKRLEDVFTVCAGRDSYFNEERAKRFILPLYISNADPGFKPHSTGPKTFPELIAALKEIVADYERREAARTILATRPATISESVSLNKEQMVQA